MTLVFDLPFFARLIFLALHFQETETQWRGTLSRKANFPVRTMRGRALHLAWELQFAFPEPPKVAQALQFRRLPKVFCGALLEG